MASTFGFTTEAKVKSRIKNFNSSITTTEVEEFITHAEGLVISVSKIKWTSDGNSSIPELIERVTTDLAAIHLLANDPTGGGYSLAEAAFIADVLWACSTRDLKYLGDEIIVKKLKEDSSN
ncbi:hypothetical protein LCGC14_1416110 [marine sediment metagenome]|uniref:Uncharacterized protein n=1 Tax=marine sediment metagenome TaxID=412755 RepID=A0A0F9KDZ9_9ZZZZ